MLISLQNYLGVINIFRSNSILGTILLALFFTAIRLPAEWIGVPLLPIEVKFLALGEKIAEGNWIYIDIWDNTPMLPAFVYGIFYFFFGKNAVPLHILASLLVFVQAIQWNYWLVKTKMYHERNQVPALIYLLLASLCWDCFTLTPEILANTFLIMALGNLLLHLNEQYHYQKGFDIGIYLGIAILCYFPSIFWFLGVMFVFATLSGTQIREYILLFLGAFLPFALFGLIFYFKDAFGQFVEFFALSGFWLSKDYAMSFLHFAIFLAVPIIFLLFGILFLLQSGGFINYQIRSQQALLFMLIFGILGIFFVSEISIHSFAPLWAIAAFFVAHLFLLLRKNWLREVLFSFFLLTCIGLNYIFLFQKIPAKWQTYIPLLAYLQVPDVQKERIWFLGKRWEFYLKNKVSTPYFHYELAQKHLQFLDYYDIQAEIYDRLSQDLPTLILGDKNMIEKLFTRLPTIAQKYEYQGEKGWWKLKSSEISR